MSASSDSAWRGPYHAVWEGYEIDALRLDPEVDLVSLCWARASGPEQSPGRSGSGAGVRVLSSYEFRRVVVAATVAQRRRRRFGWRSTIDFDAMIARVLSL